MPCIHCLGLYASKRMKSHSQVCPSRPKNLQGDDPTRAGRSLFLTDLRPKNIELGNLEDFAKRMKKDSLTTIILSDTILVAFANALISKKRGAYRSYIIQRLREMARLLQACQEEVDEHITMKDILTPAYFTLVVRATRKLAYQGEAHMKCKAIGVKIGHSLRKCASLAQSSAIMQENNDEKQKF